MKIKIADIVIFRSEILVCMSINANMFNDAILAPTKKSIVCIPNGKVNNPKLSTFFQVYITNEMGNQVNWLHKLSSVYVASNENIVETMPNAIYLHLPRCLQFFFFISQIISCHSFECMCFISIDLMFIIGHYWWHIFRVCQMKWPLETIWHVRITSH